MNSVKWPRSPRVLVPQWIEGREVMGSIPVRDSDFFVPSSCHVDYLIFITFIITLSSKFTIIYFIYHLHISIQRS